MDYNYTANHMHNTDPSLSLSLSALQEDAKRFKNVRDRLIKTTESEQGVWLSGSSEFSEHKVVPTCKTVHFLYGPRSRVNTSTPRKAHKAVDLFTSYFAYQVDALANTKFKQEWLKYRPVRVEKHESALKSFGKATVDNISTLSSFSQLRKGWDSYDAEPLEKELIEFCKFLVTRLPKNMQPDIFPTPRGTIQLEYEREDGRYLEVEVSSERLEVYGSDAQGKTVFDSSYVDWLGVIECIEWVNAE